MSPLRSGTLVAALLAGTGQLPSLARAQAPGDIPGSMVGFPAVTYACVAFMLPADEKPAVAAIEAARVRWLRSAAASGIQTAGSLFVHGRAPRTNQASDSLAATPVAACAVVPDGTTADSLRIMRIPARRGIAGYCSGGEVEVCLDSAARRAGFDDEHPWPNLPVYAPWPDDHPAPDSVDQVVAHLATSTGSPTLPVEGMGESVKARTGLQPLVTCEETGCHPTSPHYRVVRVKGTAWFIPLDTS